MGLRYTQFHTTSLCSPTRAALITGRNHHAVGFGVISEASTGYPGYDSVITKDKATIGTILKANGYATSWFGRTSIRPHSRRLARPFDQWPVASALNISTASGRRHESVAAYLYLNTTRIDPYVEEPELRPRTGMAHDAISYLNQLNELDPKKPFFLYYAPGGTHAPHHPTPEWNSEVHAQVRLR